MQANTENLLRCEAPAALATTQRHGLSDTYSFLSTRAVVDALETDNWAVVEARQTRTKSPEFQSCRKHEIILADRDLLQGAYNIFSEVPRVILSNSHDGGAAFKLQAGLWRVVCSNGMVVSDGLIQAVNIRHSRRTIEEVVQTAQAFRENAALISDHVTKFKQTALSDAAAIEFARQAIALRISDDSSHVVEIRDVLAAQRREDVGNDLWHVFNRAQEWLLKGGFPVYRRTPTDWVSRKAKAIKAINESSRLNTNLWALAEQFSLS
jgi:Domain of unknown function (DUF932)